MLHLERQRSGSEISPAFLVSATHGGYQVKVSLIRASLKYLHIWTKLAQAAKFVFYGSSFVMQNYHF